MASPTTVGERTPGSRKSTEGRQLSLSDLERVAEGQGEETHYSSRSMLGTSVLVFCVDFGLCYAARGYVGPMSSPT